MDQEDSTELTTPVTTTPTRSLSAWVFAGLGWLGIVSSSTHFHYSWWIQLGVIIAGVVLGFGLPGKPTGGSRKRAVGVALVAIAAGFAAAHALRDASPSIHEGMMAAIFALMFGNGARQAWEIRALPAER